LFQPSPDTFGAVRPVGSSLTIPIFYYKLLSNIFRNCLNVLPRD
jgi:type III secretory pathway component EscT